MTINFNAFELTLFIVSVLWFLLIVVAGVIVCVEGWEQRKTPIEKEKPRKINLRLRPPPFWTVENRDSKKDTLV